MRYIELPIKTFSPQAQEIAMLISGDESEPPIDDCKDSSVTINTDHIIACVESNDPNRCFIITTYAKFIIFLPYRDTLKIWIGETTEQQADLSPNTTDKTVKSHATCDRVG